jgi:hypothetical protein
LLKRVDPIGLSGSVVPISGAIVTLCGTVVNLDQEHGVSILRLTELFDIVPSNPPGMWQVEARELASGKAVTRYLCVSAHGLSWFARGWSPWPLKLASVVEHLAGVRQGPANGCSLLGG